jgi:hypothetical protein
MAWWTNQRTTTDRRLNDGGGGATAMACEREFNHKFYFAGFQQQIRQDSLHWALPCGVAYYFLVEQLGCLISHHMSPILSLYPLVAAARHWHRGHA